MIFTFDLALFMLIRGQILDILWLGTLIHDMIPVILLLFRVHRFLHMLLHSHFMLLLLHYFRVVLLDMGCIMILLDLDGHILVGLLLGLKYFHLSIMLLCSLFSRVQGLLVDRRLSSNRLLRLFFSLHRHLT